MKANLEEINRQLQGVVSTLPQNGDTHNTYIDAIADAVQGYASSITQATSHLASYAQASNDGLAGAMGAGMMPIIVGGTFLVSMAFYGVFFKDPFAR